MSIAFAGYTAILNQIHTNKEAIRLYKTGETYYNTQDYDKAKPYYEQAAKSGHIDAMAKLAVMYQCGDGVEKNCQKAVNWWIRAHEFGHPTAAKNTAFLYKNGGERLEKDYDKSLEYYHITIDNGDYSVAVTIGEIYEEGGHGVKQNFTKASNWYHIGIDNGNIAEGNFKIGNLKERSSDNYIPNYAEAKEYYVKAFKAGNSEALVRIGDLYMKGGFGITGNLEKAEEYYQNAVKDGYKHEGYFRLAKLFEKNIKMILLIKKKLKYIIIKL